MGLQKPACNLPLSTLKARDKKEPVSLTSENSLSADLSLNLGYNEGVETAVGLLAPQRRLPIETDSDYWTVCTRCGQSEIACQARDKGAKRI